MYLQRDKERKWCNYEKRYPFLLQGLPSLPKSFWRCKNGERGDGVFVLKRVS